jgi:hypothetical protein
LSWEPHRIGTYIDYLGANNKGVPVIEQWVDDVLIASKWLPFSGSSNATASVLTAPGHSYANSDSVIVTSKTGGTLPTGTWTGLLTVAGSTTDTFTAGVATTTTGDGLVRKVTTQAIASGVTMSISANTMIVTLA